MTLIMHNNYGYTSAGKSAFAINRVLRIYPLYWAAILLSILLIFAFGDQATSNYYHLMYMPDSGAQWFQNLALAFLRWRPIEASPILAPAAWALTVELFFYMLICLGVSKTALRVSVWVLVSLVYISITYVLGWPWQDRYFPIAAGSLPFSIGASIFFLTRKRISVAPKGVAKRLLCFLLAHTLLWGAINQAGIAPFSEGGFYINLMICSALVYYLALGAETYVANYDKVIGGYSYPIYLRHWQMGFVTSWLVFGESFNEFTMRGLANFLLTCLALIPISWMMLRYVDQPIQEVRSRIKMSLRN